MNIILHLVLPSQIIYYYRNVHRCGKVFANSKNKRNKMYIEKHWREELQHR